MTETQNKMLKTGQDMFCHLPDDLFKRETAALYDCLYDELELNDAPSAEQVKSLIKMLPLTIINDAVEWGFSDTLVRENVHLFVRANKEKFKSDEG